MERTARRLILFAYTCSGFAGLVYQVTWTRLMVLHVGHSTAAVTTVVAAFMAGLAIGAAIAAPPAGGMTRSRAIAAYATLEAGVGLLALMLPTVLAVLQPALASTYLNGDGG